MLGIGNFEHKLDFGFDDDVVLLMAACYLEDNQWPSWHGWDQK